MKRSHLLTATGLTAIGVASTALWLLPAPARDFNTLSQGEKVEMLQCLRTAVHTMPSQRIQAELNSMMAKDPAMPNPSLMPPQQAISTYMRATIKLAAQDCTAQHNVDPQTLPPIAVRLQIPGQGGNLPLQPPGRRAPRYIEA